MIEIGSSRRLEKFPEKRMMEIIDMMMIFMYSAIKIIANIPLLYSVLNPETSSDSPSAKSNGVRLVSAREVVSQIRKIGGIKNINHGEKLKNRNWRLTDLIKIKGDIRIRAIETS